MKLNNNNWCCEYSTIDHRSQNSPICNNGTAADFLSLYIHTHSCYRCLAIVMITIFLFLSFSRSFVVFIL
jgi:hypothetical protein